MTENHRASVIDRYIRRQRGENIPGRYELDILRGDGEIRHAEIIVALVKDPAGKPRTMGQLVDITERKRGEELSNRHTRELEAINRLGSEISSTLSSRDIAHSVLRELVEVVNSDCAMLFLVQEGELILHGLESSSRDHEISYGAFPVHKIGECLCGISVEERKPAFSSNILEDPSCTMLECKSAGLKSLAAIPLVARDEIIGVLALGSYQQRDFALDERFLQSLAHEITMGLKNSLLFEEIQKNVLLLEERLSELKHSNEKRDSLQSQLLQAQKMEAVGVLSGGIAHDFNNLLQVIQGYSDLALFCVPEGQKGYAHLREIKKAAQHAAELTKALLTFSRRIESRLRPIDLNQEIRHVTAMLFRTIPKIIDIRIDLEEKIHTVNADPSQLQQVVMNLVLNARDAMPKGGTLSIQTRNLKLDEEYCRTHLGTKPGDYVLLAISDDGSGMDSKTKALIFDPFFTTKEMGKGTGLGLSIAYGIIKSHGGHILCYSKPDEGTTFRIYLPALIQEDVESSETTGIEVITGGTETILIIDDEVALRELASEMLADFGYKVLSAPNGKEGIKLYSESLDEIHLVILDLIMPEMGGKQCLERILRVNASAKIIVASGYSDKGQFEDVRMAGAASTISKPYEARQLLTLVREALDSR